LLAGGAASCGSGGSKDAGKNIAVPAAERSTDAGTVSGKGDGLGAGKFVKLVCDSDDTLYAFYFNEDKGTVKFARMKPGQGYWDNYTLGSGESNYLTGGLIAAAVDNKNNVHVFYPNFDKKVVYGFLPAGTDNWIMTNFEVPEEAVYVYRAIDTVYHSIDMKADEWGGVHIIGGGIFRGEYVPIYIHKPLGGEWLIEKANTQMADLPQRGCDPSMQIVGSNIQIAYGGTSDVHYGSKQIGGSGWINQKIESDDNKLFNKDKEYTGIVVLPDDTVMIVFTERKDKKIKLAVKGQDAKWKIAGLTGISDWALNTSFAADKTSALHLAYYSKNGAEFDYAYKLAGGIAWKVVKLDDSKSDGYTAIAVDSQNIAHVCWSVKGDGGYVLKYQKMDMTQ
jgi:hypothetical protein